MKLIDGKLIARDLKVSLAKQITKYQEKYGRVPHLVLVRIGEDLDSVIYVRNKVKACEFIGIKHTTIIKNDKVSEKELINLIRHLNVDNSVDGILVQLPLPKHIREDVVLAVIDKNKDVDGFHPLNVAGLWHNTQHINPCTPKGIMCLLKETGIDTRGKHAVVVGRGNIVGLPVAKMLLDANATVTQCHSFTVDLPSITRQADILVVAVGKEKLITGDMVKDGVVVIDVGMNRDHITGKVCGDVDFESVAPKAFAITPVPGGVGPMTIVCLMQNTVDCFLNNMKNNFE